MTPAINEAKKAKLQFNVHEYTHDPSASSFGEEAAAKLGVAENRVFKTLVVAADENSLMVAVLPVSTQLDLKLFAYAAGVKKVVMADKKLVERTSGYVLGGVSPVGQRKKLKTIIDKTALKFTTVYVSAGRRGLEIEISPTDLCELTHAEFSLISKN